MPRKTEKAKPGKRPLRKTRPLRKNKPLKGKLGIYRSKKLLYSADLAKGYLALARGLMFKDVSPLLLQFPSPGNWGIWMLFMRASIDLVFLDAEKRVVSVHNVLRPVSLDLSTWRVYYPGSPVKYALELPVGTNIKPGEMLEFK